MKILNFKIHGFYVFFFQIADDFIEHTVSQACALAKHRKANNIDVRDVQVEDRGN